MAGVGGGQVDLDVDLVIDRIFSPESTGELPRAVPLPQLIDIMTDLWEGERPVTRLRRTPAPFKRGAQGGVLPLAAVRQTPRSRSLLSDATSTAAHSRLTSHLPNLAKLCALRDTCAS